MKKEKEELIPETNPKKKDNIIFFFIKLVIIFILFDFLNPYLYKAIGRSIIYGKFGQQVIIESICFIIILFVILIAGNKYIFTEKKNNFFKSLEVGGVMLVIAFFLLLTNINQIFTSNLNDVLSLGLYCLFIGLFEEFMCRGWIQNELIEKYSKNRKQVILSIVLSSVIFGTMHISNIWVGGQGIIETLSQVIQATGMGIYLGAIYYRSKNIWSNAFIHGFWDFAILLGQTNVIKSCQEGNPTTSYAISQLIIAIIFFIIYTLLGLYLLRKSKLQEEFNYTNEEVIKSEKKKDRIIFIIIVLVFSISYIQTENKNEVCYNYEDKEVYIEELVTPNYKEYYFKDNNLNLKLYISNGNLKLKDLVTENEIIINIDKITNFMVVKNKENYEILLVGLNDYENDTILYYSSYLSISNITNDISYLEEFSKSFEEIKSAPTIKSLGYFYSQLDDTIYPYIVTSDNQKMLLHNKEIYTISELSYKDFIKHIKEAQ